MNGHFLSNRPIRVSLATARKTAITQAVVQQPPHPSDLDPTNTTLFIGGLSGHVVEEQLRAVFGQFGDIIYVKIPQGKGCGFVQYVLRVSAERAMAAMNGKVLGNSAMRISWGRSSSRAASQQQLPSQLASLSMNGIHVADPGLPVAASAAVPLGMSHLPPVMPAANMTRPAFTSDILQAYMHSRMPAHGNIAHSNAQDGPSSLLPLLSRGLSAGASSVTTENSFGDGQEGFLPDTSGPGKGSARPSTEIDSIVDGSHPSGPGSATGSFADASLGPASPRADIFDNDIVKSKDSSKSHDMTPLFANIVV